MYRVLKIEKNLYIQINAIKMSAPALEPHIATNCKCIFSARVELHCVCLSVADTPGSEKEPQ
jgi:hypothetical protein